MKHNYTDSQLQAAIDEACDKLAQSTRVYLNALDLDNTTESWPVEAPARLDLIKSALAALPEPMDEESMLLNLLAIIHRDGGHYQAEHGTRKAVEDACKEWQRLILLVENTGLTEPKQSLSQLRPLSEAGPVPEGCVRYYTYKKDGEWTPATKHRAMQDTHYIDIRLPESAEKPNPKPVDPLVTKPISPPTPINDGGPAFPCHTNPLPGKLANAPQGMPLRDWLAGQALNGYLASWSDDSNPNFFEPYHAAKTSYAYADAMLAAREVKS